MGKHSSSKRGEALWNNLNERNTSLTLRQKELKRSISHHPCRHLIYLNRMMEVFCPQRMSGDSHTTLSRRKTRGLENILHILDVIDRNQREINVIPISMRYNLRIGVPPINKNVTQVK